MIISKQDDRKQEACDMLQKKMQELGCLPKKGDFSQQEVVFIKAHLGPWPKALVAAGLKEKHKSKHYEGNIRRRKKSKKEEDSNTQLDNTDAGGASYCLFTTTTEK